MYQFFLTLAALFLLTVLQKRLFAILHILTKYSESSMNWGSHIVATPTQLTAAVNEVDYSQVFDDTDFMIRPCSGGRSSLQIYAWKILPSKHSGLSEELLSDDLSHNYFICGNRWVEGQWWFPGRNVRGVFWWRNGLSAKEKKILSLWMHNSY